MPTRLLERCNPDSIGEFRAAAQRRYIEALSLAGTGNRTGAIYLWGYTAEMTLKAAYFSLIGLAEADPITMWGHIQPAIDRGKAAPLHIAWPNQERGHNVRAWAELLVGVRAMTPGAAYTSNFAMRVQTCGQRIRQLWKVSLRYQKNRAYLYEVRQVRAATDWLLVHTESL